MISSEVMVSLTYVVGFDPEEAVRIMLATIAPIAVVTLNGNHAAVWLCEVLF